MNWYLHIFALGVVATVALQVCAVYDSTNGVALWNGGSSVGIAMVVLAAIFLLVRNEGAMIIRIAFSVSAILAMTIAMIFPRLESLAGMILLMLVLIGLAFPVLGALFELKVVSLVGLFGLAVGYGLYFFGVSYYFISQRLPHIFAVFAITGPAISLLTLYSEALFMRKKRERRGIPLPDNYGST
jgi:hypothetical protein